jgi:carbamoyltransferase
MLTLGALPNFAGQVADMLSGVLAAVGIKEMSEWDRRVTLAYFTQSVVQRVVLSKVFDYAPGNILLVGGLFLNVKLNNLISTHVPGKTCIMPLAGDQGAGLGVYKAIHPSEWDGTLFWGSRTLRRKSFEGIENLHFFDFEYDAFQMIGNEIERNHLVNVVRGPMEFGPRALCHTSTLADPNPDTAVRINKMNKRTNEMPFAPVMTHSQAISRLEGCEKIHQSLEYMICTRDFKPGMQADMLGAAHRYPDEEVYSARPQITSDPWMVSLLDNFGPLINTSFNFHGVPIVWDAEQIRHTHMMEQMATEDSRPPITVVIAQE